mgnify:CR=1 FL=1
MNMNLTCLRIGTGFDIHRLVPGRKLMLGGMEIPFEKGSFGHSDADVVLHALIDALLGAAGAPDIGELFPDTDPQYKDIPGEFLLRKTLDVLLKKNVEIQNIDIIILIEKPKIVPFKAAIRAKLCGLTGLHADCVGLKAKTMEGLGDIGAGIAVACQCAVLVKTI